MWYRFAGVPKLLSNPIKGGFYVNDKPIAYGQNKGVVEWSNLLQTSPKNINNQEKLFKFLSNPIRFEIKDGKKIYLRTKSLDLMIPFTFYVNDEEITEGRVYNLTNLVKLLQTDHRNINNQEKLNEFLSNSIRFEIKDGKKIYLRTEKTTSLDLIIPFNFYVNGVKITKGSVFPVTVLKKLLKTAVKNINTQEKLKEFLSDPRRFEIKDGAYFYKPSGFSNRESKFVSKFNNYNKDSIYIEDQQKIRIFYKTEQNINVNKILKLDFAFKKNEKILLALEINGIQHYAFSLFGKSKTYDQWQNGLNHDILKINYCHNNNIPLLIFNHMLSDKDFETILNNLYQNPHVYDNFIPPSVIDENVNNTSIEFVKRQIYSHLYPVFNGIISFANDEDKKKYIKDTLILISKLMGIYEGGIDKTDYIRSFDTNVDLTSNYNICLSIYNSLYPDFSLDEDEKITYSDLSKKPRFYKEKPPVIEPAENLIPSEEDITFEEEE